MCSSCVLKRSLAQKQSMLEQASVGLLSPIRVWSIGWEIVVLGGVAQGGTQLQQRISYKEWFSVKGNFETFSLIILMAVLFREPEHCCTEIFFFQSWSMFNHNWILVFYLMFAQLTSGVVFFILERALPETPKTWHRKFHTNLTSHNTVHLTWPTTIQKLWEGV